MQCIVRCGYHNLGISEIHYGTQIFRGHFPAVSGSSHLCGKIYTGADSASDAGTQPDDVYCYLYEKIHAGHRGNCFHQPVYCQKNRDYRSQLRRICFL